MLRLVLFFIQCMFLEQNCQNVPIACGKTNILIIHVNKNRLRLIHALHCRIKAVNCIENKRKTVFSMYMRSKEIIFFGITFLQ